MSKVSRPQKSKDAPHQSDGQQGALIIRKRPRCKDGSLNKQYRVNRAFGKHDEVGDYYLVENPDLVVLILPQTTQVANNDK